MVITKRFCFQPIFKNKKNSDLFPRLAVYVTAKITATKWKNHYFMIRRLSRNIILSIFAIETIYNDILNYLDI